MFNLIDTHAHLYLPDFKADRQEIIDRALTERVIKIYLPAIDSDVINDMMELEALYPELFVCMMGLHPCSVKENFEKELSIVNEWLTKRPFAAVGEIGLDFYWDTTFKQQQYEAFQIQMQWSLDRNLPIVIHTRNAMDETIETVKPFADKGLTGIFHCFSGTAGQAQKIIDMNFYLGIGGVVTYKKAGLAEVITEIGIDKLVLETDSPYLTPVPFRGKRNESSYLKYIVEKIAGISNRSIEEIAEITTTNAKKVFAY
ncbi:MAG: putative deoxyribonuclease YcfH [Chitinophagaceae bacterium]|nr:putative deoxyribonuclease YcfH [Chitinophagaceae bacterium]